MKRKIFLLLCALLTTVGALADVVPTASTPSAGNNYYLYNPVTGKFLFRSSTSDADGYYPYVQLKGDAWTLESSDKDGYYKLRLKGNETAYFWGRYWTFIQGNYSKYPDENYFQIQKVENTDNDYKLHSFAWDGTANSYVYINAENGWRVAGNSQDQGSLDTRYTIWQFVTEADYATYISKKYGEDVSSKVTNTTFESNINGWTAVPGFTNNQKNNNQYGAFTGYFWENWRGSGLANKMSQTITNIDNGVYTLVMAAFVNTLDAENQYVFANDDKTHLTTTTPTYYEVQTLVKNKSISIGLEQTTTTANWMGIDNVHLYYHGNDISYYSPTTFDGDDEATKDTWYAFTVESAGVYKITSSAAATIRYTQNSSDDADTGGKTMSLATGGYTVMKLSEGTFYFKSDANSTITISTTLANGDDVTTAFITNPSFDTNFEGWNFSRSPIGSSIKDDNNLPTPYKVGSYAQVANNYTGWNISQTLNNLPAGKYILSLNAKTFVDVTAFNLTMGANSTKMGTQTDAATYYVAYEADAITNVPIGFNTSAVGGSGHNSYWRFDEFTLTYYETLPDVSITDLTSSAMAADVRAALTSASSTYNDSKTVANYNALQTAIVNAKVSIADFAGRTGADADWTDAISNPSFETGNLSGWTNVGSIGTQSNDAFDPYKSGTYYAEKWHNSGSKSVKQSLILSAGTYKITAAAHASNDVTSPQLLAGSSVVAVREKAQYDVYFKSDGTEAIEIGFGGTCTGSSWIAVDNFRLTYNPTLPVSISAVEGKMKATVASEQAAAVDAYNATSGQTIDNMVDAQAAIYAAQLSKQVYDEIATIRDNYQTKANALDAAGQAAYTAAINVASSGALTQYTEGTYTNTSEAEAAFSRDYGTALKAQTTPGTDLSELITNTNLYGKEFFNKTGDVNQEITGLSNGYYLITAQAYYRAGDKRTTGTAQNAKLYGNTTEVSVVNINTYTAQNIAPSNGGTWIVPTDCKFYVPDDMTAGNYAIKTLNAYHNSVAVNVTNGTLTLGIKKESKIDYDWTYWDNFKLIYLGESLPATLTGVSGDMNSEVSSAQESAVAAYNAVSGQTVANYNAAANAIIAAEASISLYNKISEDVTAYGEDAATLDAAGQTAYANEVVSINSKYSAGSYTSFGEADEELSAALLTAVKSQGAGSDWTKIITNPSFENSDMSCWTFDNFTNTGDRRESGGGSDGSYHGAFWKENYNSASDQAPGLHQSVTLPAGFYRLEFDAYNHNGSGHTWKEVQLYFGATESDKLAYNTTYQSWRTFGFEFEVTETTTANLGAKFTPTENGSIWEHVDNFRLTYLGNASATMQVSGVAKMGTFCAPFNVEIPSGVKAYTLSDGTSDDWVHMNEVEGTTIAAGTPVLLTSDTKVEQEFVGQMTVLEPNNDGLLKGVFVKTEVASGDNNYILQYQDSKCAFYIVSDAGIYIGKNRCYLHVAKTSARIAIDREEDGFTGINEVKSVEAEARTMKDGKYFVKGRIIVVKNGKVYGTNGQILN